MTDIIKILDFELDKTKTYVYVDYKPDMTPFYVGIGNYKRILSPNRNSHHKNICEKYEDCFREVIAIFENRKDAENLEISLINKYGRKDVGLGPLVNLTDGGEGILNISPHSREKSSKTHKAMWANPEYREKMCSSRTTHEYRELQRNNSLKLWNDDEFRESISNGMKEKWKDSEHREKMLSKFQSESCVEKHRRITSENWKNEEFRDKVLSGLNSKENIERQSLIMKTRWLDEEFREKQRTIRHTPEFKERQGKAIKDCWLDEDFRKEQTQIKKDLWSNEEYVLKVKTAINTPQAKAKRKELSEMRRQYAKETIYTGSLSKITKNMAFEYFNMGPKL